MNKFKMYNNIHSNLNDSITKKLILDNNRLKLANKKLRMVNKRRQDEISLKEIVIKALNAVLKLALSVKDKAAQAAIKVGSKLIEKIKQSPEKASGLAKMFFEKAKQAAKTAPGAVANKLLSIGKWLLLKVSSLKNRAQHGSALALYTGK